MFLVCHSKFSLCSTGSWLVTLTKFLLANLTSFYWLFLGQHTNKYPVSHIPANYDEEDSFDESDEDDVRIQTKINKFVKLNWQLRNACKFSFWSKQRFLIFIDKVTMFRNSNAHFSFPPHMEMKIFSILCQCLFQLMLLVLPNILCKAWFYCFWSSLSW